MKTCLFSINKLFSSQISNKFVGVHNKSIDKFFCFSSKCMILKIRRSLLIQDMIREFKDSKMIDKKLKLVVTSLNGQEELGGDFGGVLRHILSAFWSEFFKGHATGDKEMVPYLRHEFGATEWVAIARIIVKGYNDVGYYPITINNAFMVSCVFGEQAVSEEMLFRSFLNFITYEKRETVKCSLLKDILDLDEGGTDEDILEILNNFNCKRLVRNGKELTELLTEVAHEELMQTPCYIREAFETVFLYTKFIKDVGEMEQIYNQVIPSCKKVLKILKPDIRDLHLHRLFEEIH